MESEILRQIGTISRSLDSISNVEFAQFDLAKGQYLYLSRIKENPGIIQHRLSELLCVDKSTANRAINKLEEKGLITKKDDLVNKKEKHLFITQKGEEIYPVIIRENEYSTKVATENISPEKMKVFVEVINKMADNISQNWLDVKKGIKRNYQMEQEVEIRLKVVTLQDVKQLQKISMETFSDTFKDPTMKRI